MEMRKSDFEVVSSMIACVLAKVNSQFFINM
jgi:hypothetical protein